MPSSTASVVSTYPRRPVAHSPVVFGGGGSGPVRGKTSDSAQCAHCYSAHVKVFLQGGEVRMPAVSREFQAAQPLVLWR